MAAVYITFVSPSRSLTGGSRVVNEYASHLHQRGHNVTIVSPVVPPHPRRLLRELGIVSVAKKALQTTDVQWNTEATIKTVPTLSPVLLNQVLSDGDVVVASSWRSVDPVFHLDKRIGEKVHLLQHYEAWELWNDETCWQRAEKLANRRGEPIYLSMADIETNDLALKTDKSLVDGALEKSVETVAVSGWLARLVSEKFDKQPAGIIHNAVNQETFSPVKENQNDQPVVLAPYREPVWKGAADAIEAFRTIRQEMDEVKFKMFGPIKPDIPDWIEYYEAVTDSALRHLYATADLFVFPSWVEGFGLPPMEAMACGTATVSTDVGAVAEYADPGQTIETVPSRDPDALAEAVMMLIEDDQKRSELATAACQQATEFSWEAATDDLIAVFREVTNA